MYMFCVGNWYLTQLIYPQLNVSNPHLAGRALSVCVCVCVNTLVCMFKMGRMKGRGGQGVVTQ